MSQSDFWLILKQKEYCWFNRIKNRKNVFTYPGVYQTLRKNISISFEIWRHMVVVTVLLSILNQMVFHSIQNRNVITTITFNSIWKCRVIGYSRTLDTRNALLLRSLNRDKIKFETLIIHVTTVILIVYTA